MSSGSIYTNTNVPRATPASVEKKMGAALAVLLFGLFLVYGAAYASPTTLHNAAHDVRHANGFPCH